MRIWISRETGLAVNFQPDTPEEGCMLDKALGFNNQPMPIGNDRDKKIGEGAEEVGVLGGHESQRWIHFDLKLLPSR